MHAWESIQVTIEYIENHIDEEIKVEQLANIALLSPFYYQRLFHRLVKKPVMEYIKLRRMAKALDELVNNDKRIIDIALELGFTSHSHFTRTFTEVFGMSPSEYRKYPKEFNRMTKPQLLLSYTLVDEGVPLIVDDIVIEINRYKQEKIEHFIGYNKSLPNQSNEGLGIESGEDPLRQLWDRLHQQKYYMKDVDLYGDEIGVLYPCSQEGYYNYFVGAKSNTSSTVESYDIWEIPTGEYVICTCEAENFERLVMDVLYKAQQYIYSIWLPNHNLQTAEFCIERYASHSADTSKMEIWLKTIS